MNKTFLVAILFSLNCFAVEIVGDWISSCQNYSSPQEGYASIKPVDTFNADGTASLRVHAFEKKGCKGKEWDAEVISCSYELGNEVVKLINTRELNLICDYNGGKQYWYEIVERYPKTIRFGSKTGLSPSERPEELGNVYYSLK